MKACPAAEGRTARSTAPPGPRLFAECRTIGGCPTGDARLTRGHDLPARFVIRSVCPIWRGDGAGEPELLASAIALA